jgi:hypothetical protein
LFLAGSGTAIFWSRRREGFQTPLFSATENGFRVRITNPNNGGRRKARPPLQSLQHALLSCEAIEQPVTARAAQISLAAAANLPARGMRCIPRPRRHIVAQTLAVDMAQHRSSRGAARPVAAAPIFAGPERAAIRLRAGENVVTIGRIADARNDGSPFRQGGLHAELVAVAVKTVDVLRDNLTFKVLPGAESYAVARIDGRAYRRRPACSDRRARFYCQHLPVALVPDNSAGNRASGDIVVYRVSHKRTRAPQRSGFQLVTYWRGHAIFRFGRTCMRRSAGPTTWTLPA